MFSERVHQMLPKPQPGRRARQKASTRERILEVARSHLERSGYEASSIRAIAKEAGVASGTVLLHFHDKQDLLHAALFDDLEHTWAEARRTSRKRSFPASLVSLAGTFFDYYARRPLLSRTLLRESLFALPPWRERFAGQVAAVHAHIVELASQAQSRGEIAPSVDTNLLGAAFFSFYYFALLAWLQGGHPDPLRLFRRMLEQHTRGLTAGAESRISRGKP